MKIPFALIVSFLLSSCLGGNSDKTNPKVINDLTIQGLRGRIKSVTEYDYKFVEQSGTFSKKLSNKTTYLYNENGNEVETIFYTGDGVMSANMKYAYNQVGQKTEMRKVDLADSLIERAIYYHDVVGRDTENIGYNGNGSFKFKEKYKYDNDGDRIEERHYFPDQKGNFKTLSKFDDHNNIIGSNFYNADETLVTRFELQYDEKGNITGTMYYDHGALVDEKTKYENFDAAKNWLNETIFLDGKPNYWIEKKIEYY